MKTENPAKAQAESIIAMVAALNCDYDRLQELRDEREQLSDAVEEAEAAYSYHDSDDTKTTPEWRDLCEARAALVQWDDDNAQELNNLEHEAGDCTDQDEAQERIQESILSLELRSGWVSYGDTLAPEEFRIVLCTGGPHVEIRGELDQDMQPHRAWLQYQDWGTPMTQYMDISQSTLIEFCAQFHFGE